MAHVQVVQEAGRLTPICEADLIWVHDAICQTAGKICLSPIEVGLMLDWVQAGMPLEAINRALRGLKRQKETRRRFPTKNATEIVEELAMEAWSDLKLSRLGS